MSGPTVQVSTPPSFLFQFPPSSHPDVLPPPTGDRFLAAPFSIPLSVYNSLLSVYYPITFALVYATAVTAINQANRKREYVPWGFSKTFLFQCLVITHNVFLAVFSGWTFVGMTAALRHSFPGWHNENGLAALVDSMCKINGPRGLGDATTYNPSMQIWEVTNKAINLDISGMPDTTDLGRLWNEGLAFWGWLFYVSKFYEVLDTAIILTKGKKSSMLQTYHHAGAMLSLSVRVPQAVKRTITSMQITQFVVGATFALAHLFVSYSIPVSTPYTFVHNLSVAASSISSAATQAATAVAAGSIGGILKKLAFRAAAQEGLAENVRNSQGQTFGIDATHAAEDEKAREETRYRTEYRNIHCIDTSGEAFAIYLNIIYLLPLTWLFVNFFIRSYLGRMSHSGKKPPVGHSLKASSKDAMKGIEHEIKGAVKEEEGHYLETDGVDGSKKLHDFANAAKQRGGDLVGAAQEKGGELAQAASARGRDAAETAKAQGGDLANAAKEKGGHLADAAKTKGGEAAEYMKEKGGDVTNAASDKTEDIANAFTAKTGELARAARGKIEDAKEEAKKRPDEGMADKIHELAEALKANIGDIDEKKEGDEGDGQPKKEDQNEPKPAKDDKSEAKADANKAKGEGDRNKEGDKSRIPQAKRDSSRKPDARKDEAKRPQSSRSSSSKNTNKKTERKNEENPKKENGDEHHPDEEFELHNGEKADEMLPQTRPNSTEDEANGA
ncbi:MAG: hypothetical protein M1836_001848 [Candelina mexicana]|nr:MAG: hypothetical protein M1836_001848 [Candelina mexicana]